MEELRKGAMTGKGTNCIWFTQQIPLIDPRHSKKDDMLWRTAEHYLRMGPDVDAGAKLIHGGLTTNLWEKTAHEERRNVQEEVMTLVGMDRSPLQKARSHWNTCILPDEMYKRLAERAVEAHLTNQSVVVKPNPVSDRQLADMWWDATFQTSLPARK
jgi:hypothetical protein